MKKAITVLVFLGFLAFCSALVPSLLLHDEHVLYYGVLSGLVLIWIALALIMLSPLRSNWNPFALWPMFAGLTMTILSEVLGVSFLSAIGKIAMGGGLLVIIFSIGKLDKNNESDD